MFFNDTEQRHKPHFHAVYGEYSATYSIEGDILSGKLPPKQHKLVVAWAAIHQDELIALWRVMLESGEYFQIKGLE